MFLQARVKNCVHGGMSASVHAGIHTPRADTPLADIPQGRHPLGRHPPGQTPPQADTPAQTPPRIAADGTHPTGMHSCCEIKLTRN